MAVVLLGSLNLAAKVCRGCLSKLFPPLFENDREKYDEEAEVAALFNQPVDWQEDVSWQIYSRLKLPLTGLVGSKPHFVIVLVPSTLSNCNMYINGVPISYLLGIAYVLHLRVGPGDLSEFDGLACWTAIRP